MDPVSGVGASVDQVAEAWGKSEPRAEEPKASPEAEGAAREPEAAPPVDDKGGTVDQTV